MNSKQSIEEAARLLDIPAKELEKVIVKVEEIIKSDAAKEYWSKYFKAQEQKPVDDKLKKLRKIVDNWWSRSRNDIADTCYHAVLQEIDKLLKK